MYILFMSKFVQQRLEKWDREEKVLWEMLSQSTRSVYTSDCINKEDVAFWLALGLPANDPNLLFIPVVNI